MDWHGSNKPQPPQSWFEDTDNPFEPAEGPAQCAQLRGAEGIRFWYAIDMDTQLSRITIDPTVCHGKPCVRGLRYPVETLLELLSSGMTIDELYFTRLILARLQRSGS